MRLLLTSDWQTHFANLDSCDIALQELIHFATARQVDAIINAGDLKEQYSPIDVRVPKFWVRAIQEINKAGFRFIVLLGNHDRISQSKDSRNWLDILRAAGAEIVTVPKWKKIADGNIAFLPFTADKKIEKEWSDRLIEQEYLGPKVLICHTEIKEASLGYDAKNPISLSALHIDKYDACFAGHIHEHQRIGDNCWYIGSPFCQDWSEVNAPKGHLFAEIIPGYLKVRQLRTAIPGWYDAQWLEQNNVIPEKGALIRSVVPVTSKKIIDQLRTEEARLKKLYGSHIRLFVKSKIEKTEDLQIDIKGSTDEERVEQYVTATMPEGARFTAKACMSYLSSKLRECSHGQAIGGYVRFIRGTGEQFLSFKSLSIDYKQQGIVLINGVNKDWEGRSNGSGKTSLLSLLPVALFGRTVKGQRHDAWAREDTTAPAIVKLVFRDSQRRKIEVIRGRRKPLIALKINDVDQSTGIRGIGKDETQGQIEQVLGFDMRLLMNSIFIDQTIANGFVFGTQKDRMDLVSKLQNLERFDVALKSVASDIHQNESSHDAVTSKIEHLEDDLTRLQDDLRDLELQVETSSQDQLKESRTELNRLVKEHAGLSGASQYYKEKREVLDDLLSDLRIVRTTSNDIHAELLLCKKQLALGKSLIASGKCDKCGQDSVDAGKQFTVKAGAKLSDLETDLVKHQQSVKTIEDKIQVLQDEQRRYVQKLQASDAELELARRHLANIEKLAKEEIERNSKLDDRKVKLESDLKKTKRFLHAAKETETSLGIDRELLEYAKKSFSRAGMPLYLCAAMCPVLNKAAAEYADIFYDGRIQIRFAIVEGEFDVLIVNPVGSENIGGQSVGESAMAGIITAFAVTEVAPRTNLLVLDEPGHGLDEEGAKRFAYGLLKLKEKFETILVVTHNSAIESVLSGEKSWIVEKENGVSSLVIQ